MPPYRFEALKELRGDLDRITMKALDKERSRRYPSASELAADLERHSRRAGIGHSTHRPLSRRQVVRKHRQPWLALPLRCRA